ncbi:MAG: hypothetical protein EBZ59_07285 [Planctomycetia bacterium]|nr:hypothetical protein [Planctomycetia bacterium]
MPSLKSMFPRRFLGHEDIGPAGSRVAVTIRQVYIEQIRKGGGPQSAMPAETEWRILFAEYPKPMGLRASRAKQIAKLLGSENTDDWIGQRIQLRVDWYDAWGEQKLGILVDSELPPPLRGHIGQGRSRVSADPDMRPIGQAAADRFLAAIKQLGTSYDAWIRWLKNNVDGGLELAAGVEIPSLPAELLRHMKTFLDSSVQTVPAHPGSGEASAAVRERELVDPVTGEVIDGPGPRTDPTSIAGVQRGVGGLKTPSVEPVATKAAKNAQAKTEEVDESDIPF